MAKVVAFSDSHFHAWPSYSHLTPEGFNDRLIDTVKCVEQIRDYCVEVGAEVCLFGGDLFQNRRATETVTYNTAFDVLATFKQYGIQLLMIHGNHDQPRKSVEDHALRPFRKICHVIDHPGWTSVETPSGEYYRILGIPYTEDREAVKNLCKSPQPRGEGPKILLAHLGIQGAALGADFVYSDPTDCEVSDLNSKAFDVVLVGHYHIHQKLNKNTYYIGATLQHNWGDRGQVRGFIEYDTKTKKLKQIETNAPKFVEVEDLGDAGWSMGPDALKGNFVRLVSDVDYGPEERLGVLEEIGARSFEVVKRQVERKVVERTSLTPGESYDKIIDKYIAEVGTELDPVQLAQMGRDIMKEVL